MQTRKRLYLYPFTNATTRSGGNTYILELMQHLGQHFTIINKQTNRGLLDVVQKIRNCDVLYFNWIEDVADKKFGAFQVMLLYGIIRYAKLANIKIVWFVHNNLSHRKKNLKLKKRVVDLMKKNADVILTHSAEAQIRNTVSKVLVFDHPVEMQERVPAQEPFAYDLLIWGTVTPYKGVEEFLRYNQTAETLKKYRILIAGKFASPDYFQKLMQWKAPNIDIEDKILSEAELEALFRKCRTVLFTYNSASVLSSAALCKTLAYGKTIIGPRAGSFKELGAKDLIYNYDSFEQLETLLPRLTPKESNPHFLFDLEQYINQHSWPAFAAFVSDAINGTKKAALRPVA